MKEEERITLIFLDRKEKRKRVKEIEREKTIWTREI